MFSALSPFARLGKLTNEAASDQPSEGLDEEVPRKMTVFSFGPVAHGAVAHHSNKPVFEEREPRRPVRQPADVRVRGAQQTIRGQHQPLVKLGSRLAQRDKYQALRGLRVQVREFLLPEQVADKKTAWPIRFFSPLSSFPFPFFGRRGDKPESFESFPLFAHGHVSPQIRLGKLRNPRHVAPFARVFWCPLFSCSHAHWVRPCGQFRCLLSRSGAGPNLNS